MILTLKYFALPVLLIFMSCDKVVQNVPTPVHPLSYYENIKTYSLPELFELTNIDSLKCSDSLKDKNSSFIIKAYIFKDSINSTQNIFFLFSEASDKAPRIIKCDISPDFLNIYVDMKAIFASGNWQKIVVKGFLVEENVYSDTICKKEIALTHIVEVGLP